MRSFEKTNVTNLKSIIMNEELNLQNEIIRNKILRVIELLIEQESEGIV